MNKSHLIALLSLICVLGLTISTHAQDADKVVITIPFEFVAGGATLPAGEYRVSLVNRGVTRELAISGYNKGSAFMLPQTFTGAPAKEPTLSFQHIGSRYFLSKVKTLEGVYTMVTPTDNIALAQMKNQTTLSSSGTN